LTDETAPAVDTADDIDALEALNVTAL